MGKYGFSGNENIIKLELTKEEKDSLNELGISTGNSGFKPKVANTGSTKSYTYDYYDYVVWLLDYREYVSFPLFFNKFEDESFNKLVLENKLEFIIAFVKNINSLKVNSFDMFDSYLILLYETKEYIYNNPNTNLSHWYEHVMKKVYGDLYITPLTSDYVYFDRNVDFLCRFLGGKLNC